MDLTQTEEDLRDLYSDALVERVGLFRLALQRLATRHPTLEVRFSYATRGSTDGIHAKVKVKGKSLEEKLQKLLPGAIGRVEFLGASELWERASTRPTYTLELTYEENATSGTSHVALVSLRDYLSFISDESGTIRRHIFDWNVRDYEGDVEVNREMGESLRTDDAPQFWWLNNGVTIICSTTSIVGKKYVLDDVQIVNGLQTSYTIHRVLHDADATHPALDHLLLVRILVTKDPVTRDRVIRATNSQTKVSAASLRATDNIQRRIEAFFLSQGWFYDRRKNYYRNIGKTPDRIVGIPLLAQAVMAVGLSRPDDSRARPSSLIKRDEDYEEIFSGKTDLAVYLWAAKAQKNVDAFLLSDQAKTTRPERTNLRFHLAMLATAKLFGGRVHAPVQLANLAQSEQRLSDTDLPASLSELRSYYDEFAEGGADSLDKIAKGSDFVDFVLGKAFP